MNLDKEIIGQKIRQIRIERGFSQEKLSEKIDISQLVFRDEHAARHGCTVEEARGYVDNAYCSIRRKRWDKIESINYYSKYGAAYVDSQTLKIKTSYSRNDYKSDTKAIVEVFE